MFYPHIILLAQTCAKPFYVHENQCIQILKLLSPDIHGKKVFLNTGGTDETFQQSGEQHSFRHILKSSAT